MIQNLNSDSFKFMQYDEYYLMKKRRNVLKNKDYSQNRYFYEMFREMPIQFPPTYKYHIGTDSYKINKKVFPCFTDRIFFWTTSQQWVLVPVNYSCDGDMRISDHKPVFAQFEILKNKAK